MTRAERRWLVAILVVAAVVRVAWSVWAARTPAGLHDPSFYLLYGDSLASGDGYRLPDGSVTAYYPPGYSFSLAPFFWLVPDSWHVGTASALNVVWQLLLIAGAFAVGRALAGVRAGLVAAGVLALWPNLVFHTSVALTESLFLALLAAVLLLVVRAPWGEHRFEPWRLASVGALLGVATLVRPVTIPVFPVLLLVLLLARFGWRRAIGHAALVGVAAFAVLLPWAIRNAVVVDAFTLSTNTGDNLCMSRRVGGSGGFEFPNPRCFPARFDEMDRPESEVERDAYGRELAIDFVTEHPGEELRLVVRRIGHTFDGDADGLEAVESYGDDPWLADGTRDLLRRLATGYGLLVGLAAVPGLWLLGRRSEAGFFTALVGIGMLLPPLVFFGDPRFHVPAVPVAALAVGVLVAGRRMPPPGRGRAGMATSPP